MSCQPSQQWPEAELEQLGSPGDGGRVGVSCDRQTTRNTHPATLLVAGRVGAVFIHPFVFFFGNISKTAAATMLKCSDCS